MNTLIEFDRSLITGDPGKRFVAGFDEAGRGPLAGPLSVAVYIADPFGDMVDGVNDSKKLSAKDREQLFSLLTLKALYWKQMFIDPEEIDKLNIYRATQTAMERLCFDIPEQFRRDCVVITDAMPLRGTTNTLAVVKADARSYSVAAASVIAKVLRDKRMQELAQQYPDYGFEQHKGYPTPGHLAVLRKIGPTPVHRMSYAPVRDALQNNERTLFPPDR